MKMPRWWRPGSGNLDHVLKKGFGVPSNKPRHDPLAQARKEMHSTGKGRAKYAGKKEQ